MNKKLFWVIIISIITITNVILFANVYSYKIKDNNEIIKKSEEM